MNQTPRVRILLRIAGILKNADLEAMTGVPNITVRHTRNRWSNPEEKPAISIRMVADEVQSEAYVTQNERLCYLSIDLQIDANLEPEDSNLDPTGLERLGQIAAAALTVLKDETAQDDEGRLLRELCDDVVDEGVQADDDNEADEARFIHRIVVLYRTLIDDPNHLLSHEESIP